jgi:hypothetical protein
MTRLREFPLIVALALVVLLVINLPYALAYQAGGFAGILVAPADGYSYLAKIRQGYVGNWLFTLPYTAEPGPGAFLFTYYLALGHLARWTGLGVELSYHLARLGAGFLFLMTAYHFITNFMADRRSRLLTWLVFVTSSGLGWLVVLAGGSVPADMWITESIPFLSVYANAHFPLGWALVLWIFQWTWPSLAGDGTPPRWRLTLAGLATVLLAEVYPMILVVVAAILAGSAALLTWRRRQWAPADWLPLAVVAACAAPRLALTAWLLNQLPILAAGSPGGQAPQLTPPPGEALVWGGVILALAVAGLARALPPRASAVMALAPREHLLIWIVIGALALYAPLDTQRRLSLGLWMPMTVLAVDFLREGIWPRVPQMARPLLVGVLALCLGLSNVLVWVAGLGAALTRSTTVFLTPAEVEAIDRLPAGAVVVADPYLGGVIPARSEARVVYGHPFETVGGERVLAQVEGVFSGTVAIEAIDVGRPIDVVLSSGRTPRPTLPGWRVVFQQDEVIVYAR